MNHQPPPMTRKAIGLVRNGASQRPEPGWSRVVSEIVIDPSLAEALDNLEEFSHIIVLYWMNQAMTDGELTVKTHPMGKKDRPLVGRFATRSPHRPNPVGKTVARLLRRQGNVLTVEGLDAFDGSPVIDIKPYLPGYDSVADARAPEWMTRY
ncbi:MAG: tRNA (N6-threonylcarbamoyladenosine(37)-N6)-methyltransferase TrmO [Chloroflexota bacterium]